MVRKMNKNKLTKLLKLSYLYERKQRLTSKKYYQIARIKVVVYDNYDHIA